ncbi:MAG: ABC transporter permease [Gemmatimonadaceae bacterium]
MAPRRRAFRLSLRKPEVTREELDEELAFHVEERTRSLVARGLTNEHAQSEALRKLGGSVHEVSERLQSSAEQKEKRIDMRERIQDLLDDVRYALRGLARRPAFCAIAVVTLALGIGANAAIFSAVDALLLRALPFPRGDRLMDVVLLSPNEGANPWSWPKFRVFRDAQRSYQSLALYTVRQSTLTGLDPERITAEEVSATYLNTLGVRPSVGADFAPAIDAGPNARKVALISDALWQRRFNAEPNVIGQSISVNSYSYEIIGVLPPAFHGLSGNAELWIPIMARDADSVNEVWSLEFSLIGRLRDGVSVAQARSEATLLGPRVYRATPVDAGTITTARTTEWSAAANALEAIRVAPKLRQSLLVLFGAVAMLLLIACVNLANLLLGRAATRRQEIAIRLAIGAARKRVVRLLLTESALLAFFGGLASVIVAWIGTRILSTMNPRETLSAQGFAGGIGAVSFDTIQLDSRALLFTFGITVLVACVFGLVPALQATNAELTGALKDDGSTNRIRGHSNLGVSRRSLAVLQVSLAIVLLVGSGLMLRSLSNLMSIDAGFDSTNILTLRLNVPPGVVAPDSMPGFYEELTRRLRAVAGVREVALADCAPVSNACNGTIMQFADRPASATGNAMVGAHWVTPEWFSTLRIPIKKGRAFNSFDRLGGEKVVLVNEAAVRAYFNGEEPIGKMVKVYQGGFNTGARVVGVVSDVRFGTIDSTARPDVYISYAQSRVSRMIIFVRTSSSNPMSVAPVIRQAIKEFAPRDPVYDIRSFADRVGASSAQARFSTTLLALFALVALALAIMGIYGVLSFAVVQRTREIGIRMALGANRSSVLGMVLREGSILAAFGVMLGVPAAFAVSRVLNASLFNVSTSDPATYIAIVLLVSAAALIASWLPARAAVRVDPIIALRRS